MSMMEIAHGASTSVWMSTASVPDLPSLQGEVEAKICVIGAGIAGLTSAYLLSEAGYEVVLIDAQGIGAGETSRTTAHFFPPDEWYAGVEQTFGADGARLIASSFSAAIVLVESIIKKEGIDCEFERLDGFLYARSGNRLKEIEQEFDAAKRAGVEVEFLRKVPGLSFDTGPSVRYRNQAQFHPLKYLNGLAQGFVAKGGRIYNHSRALSIEDDRNSKVVHTPAGSVRAESVVVATNTPFNNRVVMHTKQSAYQTYVVGMRIPRGSVPRILLWDTGGPYYYVRLETAGPDADYEMLVVGGADHKVGQDGHPEQHYMQVIRWTQDHFPMAYAVDYRWSGIVMEPADGAAYLGHNPSDDEHIYIITGDSGNGMTHCTIGAMVVRDLISGASNAWTSIYDPARKAIHGHGVGKFIAEQVNTLAQYRDWLTEGELKSAREIPAGQGAIIRDGAKKLAVFRDDHGELHVFSAKCTHLGCVVRWNSFEHSWDCPCHGSRFDALGQVLHGPALQALTALDQEPEKKRAPTK